MNGIIKPQRIKSILKQFDPVNYLLILGQKSNGKSTACKNVAVENAYKSNQPFAYMRRYKNDISPSKVDSYFKNIKGFSVKNITNGEFDYLKARAGEIHFKSTEDKKRDKLAGYYFSLATYEEFSSLNYPDVKYILFEEIVTMNGYLQNEFEKLQILTSSILRLNGGTTFMIGNTMSTMCPYFREFELTGIKTQKLDTVDLYCVGSDTRVCVFMTAPIEHADSYSMYIGAGASMIKDGGFIAREQRKLEYPREEYKTLYTMVLEYNDNLFLMEFLQHNQDSVIWYVTRKTTPIQKNTRTITNMKIESFYNTPDFIPLNDNEKILFNFLKNDFVAFGDNLTGTEFKQAIKLLRGEF